jgi:hypothetical protein
VTLYKLGDTNVNTKLIALQVLVLPIVTHSLCFIEALVSHDMIVFKIAKIQNASIQFISIRILPRTVAIIETRLCVDTSRNNNNRRHSAAAAAAAAKAKLQAD